MKIHYKLRHLVALQGQKFMKKVNLGRKVALRGQKFMKKVNLGHGQQGQRPGTTRDTSGDKKSAPYAS